MSDQNRGAYTPQSDAPLSFDARRAGGKRGPMPITLIFSALILLVLVVGGAVAVLYHNGTRKAGDAPQPVGEAVGMTRAPAEATNGAAAPVVTGPLPGQSPTFTAPPEQPAVRPIEATPLPPPPPPPPPPAATLTPAAPPPVVKVEPAPAPKIAEAAPKAQAAAAPVAKAATPPVKVTNGSVVQIGAYSSTTLATAGWNEVAKMMPGEMMGKTKEIDTVERDGKTLYRARIGGFATHSDADRLCLALLSKGRDCKVY